MTKFCETCGQAIKEGEDYTSATKDMHMHLKCMSPGTRAVVNVIKEMYEEGFTKMQEDLK